MKDGRLEVRAKAGMKKDSAAAFRCRKREEKGRRGSKQSGGWQDPVSCCSPSHTGEASAGSRSRLWPGMEVAGCLRCRAEDGGNFRKWKQLREDYEVGVPG